MKDTKNYFPLIGNKNEDFNWVIKNADLPFKGLDVSSREWIPSSSTPSLYLHQIPPRFLITFPGFYIFSRETVPDNYPAWILSPRPQDYIDKKRGYYQLRQDKLIDSKRAKVFCGIKDLEEFSKQIKIYEGPSHHFFHEGECSFLNPDDQIHLYQHIFNRPYFFFDLIDLKFSGFSYLHFSCLARGGVIKINQDLLDLNPSRVLKRWYGNWQLYLLEDQVHD
jgi:hypothetical protein